MPRLLLILSLIYSLLAPSLMGLAQAAEPCPMQGIQMQAEMTPMLGMMDCCEQHQAAQDNPDQGSCSADQSCCHAAGALHNPPLSNLLSVQNPPPQALLLAVIPSATADCWRPPRFV